VHDGFAPSKRGREMGGGGITPHVSNHVSVFIEKEIRKPIILLFLGPTR
jgi:hypothetical protein